MRSRRITILGGLILAMLTVVAGISVFVIMQRHAESILSTSLRDSLENRERLFQSNFERQVHDVATITMRPFLIQQIKKYNSGVDAEAARALLKRGIDSFLLTGYTSLVILDVNGREIARSGELIIDPDLDVPLQLAVPAALLWKDELIFNANGVFRDHGTSVGFIITQTKVTELTEMLSDVTLLGKTGELALCAPAEESTMQCFPMLLHPEPFKDLKRTINGKRLPMDYALAGEAGVLRAKDYRDETVVAAYMPLSTTGLGLVLKTDAAELFQTLSYQLRYVLLTLVALVVVGVFTLRWLVAPLLRQVVDSEQQTRKVNARLADKEARLSAIFKNVEDGIIVVNQAGAIESANPGVEAIFGYAASEMIGQDASMLLGAQTRGQVGDYLQLYLQTGKSSYIGAAREVLATRKDGTCFPMDIRITEMRMGGASMFIGMLRDITERKLSEKKILYLATHDALTNLPNRHLLQDRILQAITHAKRNEGTKVALLFIDLDGFKKVNDNYGHGVGDALLVEVAKRICSVLRSEDTTARQGGDEFIVTLPHVKQVSDVELIAKKLLTAIAAAYQIHNSQIHIGASIGIALYPDDGTDIEMLLKNSDTAMYTAKMAGRGAYRRYTPEM